MLQPGEQWRPTCGNDGLYMEDICATCEHDAAYRAGTGDSCEIAAAMYRNNGDPAWLIGLDGAPFCKQFKREGTPYRCPRTPDMFKDYLNAGIL